MIIIYPFDKTTRYLEAIVNDGLILKYVVNAYTEFTEETFEHQLDAVKNSDPSTVVFYLGHGTDEELQVNNNLDINFNQAQPIFKNKKIILLSCYSADFIESLNNHFEVAIGFGNILDSKTDLSYRDYLKYNHNDYECIYEFRSKVVILIKNSIIEAYINNYTFFQLYNSIKLRINKILSNCSLSDNKTTRLVGELMFDLKKHMILKGNSQALFF
jgi:hypothetical protein